MGTIAAIATPRGAGGVGIVRLSGPNAVEIVARLTGLSADRLDDRRMVHAVARDPATGDALDEVLAVVMHAPRSYTGEDVGELHAHGGVLNLAKLLAAAIAAGARPAEPGEFTRRAFERGRIDLAKAEAVADVIGAASERALRAAQAQLAGRLGERVRTLRQRALALLAEVEGSIDFPEEDLDFISPTALAETARGIEADARRLAATYGVGRALQSGIEVALVGPPNVGKSSLLNALAGEERALVAAEPGTTRDYVEARVVWDGIPVTLIDTAGDREADGALERRGVELGRARAARADLKLLVRDGTSFVAGDGLVIWNKIDLAAAPLGVLGVSALTGQGLNELKQAVLARVGATASEGSEDVLVSSERQRALLEDAATACSRAAMAATQPAELVAVDLRAAAQSFGMIVGEGVSEAMLDELFARFCIGK